MRFIPSWVGYVTKLSCLLVWTAVTRGDESSPEFEARCGVHERLGALRRCRVRAERVSRRADCGTRNNRSKNFFSTPNSILF